MIFPEHSAVRAESQNFPVPKGNSPYAQAKRAEYMEKNTAKAKDLYKESILLNQRTESAVKDLASILHQEGSTREACELLLQYRSIFTDQQKFSNLLSNLQEKLVPTGNCLNKQIRISPLTRSDDPQTVNSMFRDPSRISAVEINGRCANVMFSSHSAARKTLNGFSKWNKYTVEWINTSGEIVGPAGYSGKGKKRRAQESECAPSSDTETAILLLGRDLFAEVSLTALNVTAQPFVPSACSY